MDMQPSHSKHGCPRSPRLRIRNQMWEVKIEKSLWCRQHNSHDEFPSPAEAERSGGVYSSPGGTRAVQLVPRGASLGWFWDFGPSQT